VETIDWVFCCDFIDGLGNGTMKRSSARVAAATERGVRACLECYKDMFDLCGDNTVAYLS
jgi:hypothetical protein